MYHLPRALRLRLRQQPLRLPTPLHHHLRHRQHFRLPPRQRHFSLLPKRYKPEVLYTPRGDTARVQTVRFHKPPFFTWRRFGTIVVYGLVIYGYSYLLGYFIDVKIEVVDGAQDPKRHGQEVKDGEQQQEEEEEEEEEDEDEDEDDEMVMEGSAFIPMTWGKKMPRTYYKGSDPEWQEFIKVAKNKERHKRIQDQLVDMVFTGAKQHPIVQRQLGKDPKVGKYWLDISFPDGPPPEYERSGLEFGDGFIAWSRQRISQEQQFRITRALWPQSVFNGVWASVKVLAGINYRRIKQALGWEGKDPLSVEERYKHAVDVMERQKAAKEGRSLGNTQTQDGTSESSPALPPSTSASSPPSQPPTPPTTKLPFGLSVPPPKDLLPPFSSSIANDIPIAMTVFSHTLAKSWNMPKDAEPPRGTFKVDGMVEVRGARGRMLFDVTSAYDPRQRKFVRVTAAVRGFKRWQQSPRGGP
ncbi:hypothetical protein Tdes44962_MAKER09230 [Teratosphaeria destructans]|uniref:Uncharacterized protein n=1 Tax=Teratosphaeria destructans TaxID=418781 RepID=A0A9W7W356_9PEZI|nr:hypothetical protein Tdes44962_MAKER09230 [Teratosphaeria destructans]